MNGEPVGAVLNGLFRLVRTLSLYGETHPSGRAAIEDVRTRLAQANPPFSIQFIMGGVFCDNTLVPMSIERYERASHVARVLREFGVQEMSFTDVPSPHVVVELARILSGGVTTLAGIELPGVKLRAIAGFAAGGEVQRVDPDVFASAQAALAIADAFLLTGEGPWPWAGGLTVIRRLDRAAEVNVMATLATVERANAEWNIHRRAVAGALRVLALLRTLGVGFVVQRAAAHVALALLLQGLRERGGAPIEEAIPLLLDRMVDAGAVSSGAETHRLRTIAMLDHLARRAPYSTGAGDSLGRLVRLTYALEVARCPEGLDFDLSIVELLAEAAHSSKSDVDFLWLRMLIQVFGIIPPGAEVKLADGRIGYVLGPGGARDPMRPDVLVEGERHTPTSNVELVRPSVRAAWRG
ncbi:MAG: hypothetical protein Q8P18_27575 [Pseudomonadota bacterium]|nr:hypothetical protein [Pseudomonadota bacterium]